MTQEALFLAALALSDPAARAAYLAEACGPDESGRRRVEARLSACTRTGAFRGEDRAGPVQPTLSLKPGAGSPALALLNEPSADRPFSMAAVIADDEGEPPALISADELTFLDPPTRPDTLGWLGPYEVLAILGQGGFGIVLKAYDGTLQRVVAIKVLAPALAATSPARKRFLREARAGASVRHEHVVHIYAVVENPQPYLVMEYIPGETLHQRHDREGPMDLWSVLRVGAQIAGGLAAAHATGLVHRDVKPSNILLEPGGELKVKLTDFGLARTADDASQSQSNVIAGTPSYMAPEQAAGEAVDARADLFSLGSVLYTLVSGRLPFRASTTMGLLRRVCEDTPRPIREIIPEVPAWFCDLIARLHAKRPADRFASAAAVAELLTRCGDAVLRHGPDNARPTLPPLCTQGEEEVVSAIVAPPAPAVRRWRAYAGLLLVLVGAVGLAETAGVTHLGDPGRPELDAGGTLVVESDDPALTVTVDDGEPIFLGADERTLPLPAGPHKVWATRGGALVYRERVVLAASASQRVCVRGETVAAARPPKTPGEPDAVKEPAAWVRHVATLPTGEQFRAVAARLRALNPAFVEPLVPTVVDGRVVELEFASDHVNNLAPLALLTGLRSLDCVGSGPGKGQLAGLAPLRDLPLTRLRVAHTRVADLTPLHGLPLEELELAGTPAAPDAVAAFEAARPACRVVTDQVLWERAAALLPPAGQVEAVAKKLQEHNPGFDGRLTHYVKNGVVTGLVVCTDNVADLRAVRAFTKLYHLDAWGSTMGKGRLTDLRPLHGLPIVELNLSQNPHLTDLGPLRGLPVESLFLWQWGGHDLTPLRGLPLRQLNCGGGVSARIDLSPLRGTPLVKLTLNYTATDDIACVRGMPLEHLGLSQTRVTDLSALNGMPLVALDCDPDLVRSAGLLEFVPTLDRLNGRPVADYATLAATRP